MPHRRVLTCSLGLFFAILSTHLLRPLRDSVDGILKDPGGSWQFGATFAAMTVIAVGYSFVATRFSRTALSILCHLVYAAIWIAIGVILPAGRGDVSPLLAISCVAAANVYTFLVPSHFWGVVDDALASEEVDRTAPMIMAAGTMGGLSGSFLAAAITPRLGTRWLAFAAVAFVAASGICLLSLSHDTGQPVAKADRVRPRAYFGNLFSLSASKQMLWLGGFVLLINLASVPIYRQYTIRLKDAFPQLDVRTAVLANYQVLEKLLIMAVELMIMFLGRKRPFSLKFGFAIPPLALIGGCVSLAVWHQSIVAVVVEIARRVLDIGVVSLTKERLFAHTTRQNRFHSKVVVDTMTVRLGNYLGALTFTALGGITALAVCLYALVAAATCLCGWRAATSPANLPANDGSAVTLP